MRIPPLCTTFTWDVFESQSCFFRSPPEAKKTLLKSNKMLFFSNKEINLLVSFRRKNTQENNTPHQKKTKPKEPKKNPNPKQNNPNARNPHYFSGHYYQGDNKES